MIKPAVMHRPSEDQQSEARYRGLLEAAPDAMVVVNQLGEIVLLNVQAEKQFGYRRDELLGQLVTNIIPEGFAERIIADGTRTAAEALAQQIGTGIELLGCRRDGSIFPIEIMLSPLESDEGILVTAAIRDISVRKAADLHLAQMENRYRGLLEAAPDAMVVVDQLGKIVLLNVQAEKQFGYSRDELLGQRVTNIIPVGFAERIIADGTRTAAEALAQQIGTGIELNALRKDGTEFPIEIMLSPLESADGILVTAAIRDITVRRESDARYRGLLEAAPDAMVVVDQAGEIVLLNVQAEKQFGYSRDELVGQAVTNIIPVGFAERIIADGTRTAAEALAQQIGTGIELNALRKDGTEFPIEIMLSPLESADGILVTAAIRDITVRRESEARYRGLLEAAPDAMVVVDQRGEIVLLNVQAEKQFGYSRDELVGQAVTNIIPEGFEERLIADALRSTEDALAQQIGTGIELYGQRKDGNRFPIEIMLSPLASAGGVLVTAAIRDITLRHAADEALRVAHRKSESVLNSLNDGLAVLDKNWVYTYFNEQGAKIIGMRREELMGRNIWDLFPQVAGSKFYENYHRAVDTGQSVHFEEYFPEPLNQWLECHCHPSSEGLSVYFRDVTLAKEADTNLVLKVEELKRSNEELEQFAYIASHDLQEPLRMVASYTQLLSRKYKGKLDSDADEFIAFAVDGATRMQALIKDLLEYSRVGTKGKEFVAVSSEQALKQALRNLRGAIEDSETVITHDLLPMVSADEVQLVQLFQNLVGNAIKYQQGNTPQIRIAAFKNRSKRWEFSVGDNGLGIEPQYFERIFGMFQRLHKREEFAGTGIGLAICKKIVERHGGSISVQSTLGEGSTFHFDLTAVEGSAA